MLKHMPNHEIKKEYNEGKRDFRNISCTGTDFINIIFSGADFSGSDLSFSSFNGADFSHANFSGCNLVWCGFRHANFSGANFSKAKFNWSVFNNAIFHSTNMKMADLSWCLLFDTHRHELDLKGAIYGSAAWHESEITSKGISFAFENLEKIKHMIPYGLWLLIKAKLEKTDASFEKMKQAKEHISSYLDQIGGQYSREERKALEAMGLGAYSESGAGYKINDRYKKKGAYQK
ncbi:MAG: pentapeptide repeat-containing protein [Candidatus Aenigmarchaeota archaeon]|nr:pentapeptide repeat-containing protein [Candidatus Aenigmarchaeota archaeon]